MQPKKCGKIKATPFLDAFEVSGSESEVRILIKILVLKLSNLMTLIVRNCKVDVMAVCHCRADVMAVCYCSADVMIVITLQALVTRDKVNQV